MTETSTSDLRTLVLVTDDSAFTRRHTRRLLEDLGYRVVEASNGSEALTQFREHRPALVLLDMLMGGGMDGDEVLGRIRAIDKDTPVIVVTADVQTHTEALVRAKGATNFLNKPLTRTALKKALAEALPAPVTPLTADHRDRLAEVINIGYGRAAAALSAMTDQRIALQAPTIVVCAMNDVPAQLAASFSGEAVCVNQVFSGSISGSAMLLLDLPSAQELAVLLDPSVASPEFDAGSREVIVEVGNILLNACLGAFGNLLKVQVYFAVPRLNVSTVPGVLSSTAAAGAGPPTEAIIVKTWFSLKAGHVTGFLVILMGVAALDRIATELEEMG